MILRDLLIKLVKSYRYISPLFGQKCRYYPTCSEYALMEFENDTLFRAVVKSTVRVLRCNQLFKGGIDYPVVKKELNPVFGVKSKVKYWFVPIEKNKYILIKADNE